MIRYFSSHYASHCKKFVTSQCTNSFRNPCSKRNFSIANAVTDFNLSIATSSTVHFVKTNLIAFHEFSGLPWWVEISLVTAAARCLIAFPLTVNQRKIMLRYEALVPEIEKISKRLRQKLREEQYLLNRSKQVTQKLYTKQVITNN